MKSLLTLIVFVSPPSFAGTIELHHCVLKAQYRLADTTHVKAYTPSNLHEDEGTVRKELTDYRANLLKGVSEGKKYYRDKKISQVISSEIFCDQRTYQN